MLGALARQTLRLTTRQLHSTSVLTFDRVGLARMSTNLDELRAAVAQQGAVVRKLKESEPAKGELAAAIAELKIRKSTLTSAEKASQPADTPKVDRLKFENLMKRRFFYGIAFSLYGGVAGLYDLGPAGCALKANMVNYWRNHFVVEEDMLEVEATTLTPATILKASGHVDRFTDVMVKDAKTGECFRADHLLEAHLEKAIESKGVAAQKKEEMAAVLRQLDNYGIKEIGELLNKYDCKAPITNNDLTDPQEFNLMFATSIGPTGLVKGFLRPETAQGIFVNFKRLLDYNQDKIPFAGAQIGQSFRNEISPRSGLLRVREFYQAEIEHFMDPEDKSHPKYALVKDTKFHLYSADAQRDGTPIVETTVGEALTKGLIHSETMGYFLARIQQFLTAVGIPSSHLRFRQHMDKEMAHYAKDCWDAECKTTYGWVEIVGCADRSCFDLNAHAKATGTKLMAQAKLDTPITREVMEVTLNKAPFGKAFKKEAGAVTAAVHGLSDEHKMEMKTQLESGPYKMEVGDKNYEITPSMVAGIALVKKTEHVREFVPSVLEPSFGIGRILYCILECNFRVRENDEKRTWLDLPALIAPTKCSVLPLSNSPEFVPHIQEISAQLRKLGIPNKVDDSSGAIGRRYARTDEIGIPFGITVDFDTSKFDTVTVRERNSCGQIRVPKAEVCELINKLCTARQTWAGAKQLYPEFGGQETI